MPRINTTPFTDAQRKRFKPKLVKKPNPFAPTVQKVKEIVPNKLIPKLKPTTPVNPRPPLWCYHGFTVTALSRSTRPAAS